MLILKVIVTIFLVGVVFGGAVKARPQISNPDLNPKAVYLAGAVSFILGGMALVYMWK